MSLNRDAFLKPAKLPSEVIEVPELGDSVIVQGLTARGRSEFDKQFQTTKGKPNRRKQSEMRERLCVACCVDDAGNKLFTEADVPMLGDQPASVIEPIVNAAMRLCGMSDADVESLAKNSDETEGGS